MLTRLLKQVPARCFFCQSKNYFGDFPIEIAIETAQNQSQIGFNNSFLIFYIKSWSFSVHVITISFSQGNLTQCILFYSSADCFQLHCSMLHVFTFHNIYATFMLNATNVFILFVQSFWVPEMQISHQIKDCQFL